MLQSKFHLEFQTYPFDLEHLENIRNYTADKIKIHYTQLKWCILKQIFLVINDL